MISLMGFPVANLFSLACTSLTTASKPPETAVFGADVATGQSLEELVAVAAAAICVAFVAAGEIL